MGGNSFPRSSLAALSLFSDKVEKEEVRAYNQKNLVRNGAESASTRCARPKEDRSALFPIDPRTAHLTELVTFCLRALRVVLFTP